MKLCLIAPIPPPYGGIANWVNLVKNYISVHRKDISIKSINIAPTKRSTEGRRLWERIIFGGLDMMSKSKQLKQLIRNDKPDIIHMTTSGQLALFRDILMLKIAKKSGIPSVYHIRFGRIGEISARNTIEWQLISKAMTLASVVIAIDNITLKCIRNKLPHVNAVLIPNPIDLDTLPSMAVNNNKDIVFIGWNIKTKGVEELIQAWNNVGNEYPDYRLNLVGPCKTSYQKYLETLVHVDNLVFSGEQSHTETMNIVNQCCIFVLPSYTEGFPNAVVEAMALRKPIIATRVGAIPDMLDENCGILIDAKSVQQLEDAIRTMLMDAVTRAEMAENAYNRATKLYDVNTIFTQYNDIWNKVINETFGLT